MHFRHVSRKGIRNPESVEYAADFTLELEWYAISLDASKWYSTACEVVSELVELTRKRYLDDPGKHALKFAYHLFNYAIMLKSLGPVI